MRTPLRSIIKRLFLIALVLWSAPVTGKDLQVISIVGSLLDPAGMPVEEYDTLELGHKYRLLSKTRIQISSLDGKNIYDAVGPGLLVFDSNGSVLLNGKALKPKALRSLFKGFNATKLSTHDLAGLPFRGIQVVPDQEKRSLICEVNGYSDTDENMALAQAQKAAFSNAKEQALKIARSHLESNKLVKNRILEYDLVQSGAEGAVSVLAQKDHGFEGDRYHVWIKVEVAYVLRPKGQVPVSTKIMSPEGSFDCAGLDVAKAVQTGRDRQGFCSGEPRFLRTDREYRFGREYHTASA